MTPLEVGFSFWIAMLTVGAILWTVLFFIICCFCTFAAANNRRLEQCFVESAETAHRARCIALIGCAVVGGEIGLGLLTIAAVFLGPGSERNIDGAIRCVGLSLGAMVLSLFFCWRGMRSSKARCEHRKNEYFMAGM